MPAASSSLRVLLMLGLGGPALLGPLGLLPGDGVGNGPRLANANEARCRRDCELPINVTHAEWSVGPNPR